MASFTFQPTSEVPPGVLSADSTHAKVKIEPLDAFVDATISPFQGGAFWKASTTSIPRSSSVPLHDHRVVLVLTKGELGKYLGSIDLGNLH